MVDIILNFEKFEFVCIFKQERVRFVNCDSQILNQFAILILFILLQIANIVNESFDFSQPEFTKLALLNHKIASICKWDSISMNYDFFNDLFEHQMNHKSILFFDKLRPFIEKSRKSKARHCKPIKFS